MYAEIYLPLPGLKACPTAPSTALGFLKHTWIYARRMGNLDSILLLGARGSAHFRVEQSGLPVSSGGLSSVRENLAELRHCLTFQIHKDESRRIGFLAMQRPAGSVQDVGAQLPR